jgi:hypothetical protein
MTKLILSFSAITLAIIFTVFWILRNRLNKDGKELAIVSEIPETLIFGAMLVITGYALLASKLYNPSIAGTDQVSYNFVAILAAVCGISGSQILLTTFVKKAIAYQDKFVIINMFGLKREIPWKSVTEVKTMPMSLKVTFRVGNEAVSVNGRAKEYGEFIKIARQHIPALVGSDVLGRLYKRIMKQGIIKI